MPLAPRFYQVAPLAALIDRGLATVDHIEPADPLPDPALAFADTDLTGRHIQQQPDGSDWRGQPGGIAPNPAVRCVLRDATVHGPDGVVTLGRFAMAETLEHVWPERAGARRDGAVWMIEDQFTSRRIPQAEHLLCGNAGNYYHWLLDGIARWALCPADDTPCLLPWSGALFHAQAPAILPEVGPRALWLGWRQAIEVDRLGWSGSLSAAGTAFHPALRRLPSPAAPGSTDLFISRADATNRPLRNEAEAARMCERHGFRVVSLSGMPLADQVALFATARRIVAPHGAGLANLLFCRPGAALLELQMDAYVNWCFRRLAATMGVRYGCVIGNAELGDGYVHDRAWSLDLDRLAASLDDPRFMETP